ncbi:unnamed protein product (macronuclear) [Paramecium tetraurelia]|uniref:Uncharacterized protein n=1 Tax=Paramecium tetraurelia TaxID=5888 RepID=A0DB38_PARTE|nr:uncharacterized protein GSPATT00015149001 [Paramecium tetraurelia]CAK80255.1 unnamed protein product [Paramecium tetraurelia]|eukprot:XP_001447652.1 hypothetical protein (macronuclear) [Paramecium tetraurelia strain d4-2]
MAHLVEMKILVNQEQLSLYLPKIKEALNLRKEVTVTWRKTQQDIDEETFNNCRPIKDENQYRILENITRRISPQNSLYNEILLTMMKYDVELKDYQKFQLNIKKINRSSLKENLKLQNQQVEILKTIKRQLKAVVQIEEKLTLITLLEQENMLSKEELKLLFRQIKPQLSEDRTTFIWFLEKIQSYEKQNKILLGEIYEHYIQEQDFEKAKTYFLQMINQTESELNYEEIEQAYQYIKRDNEQILQEIKEIEEILNNNLDQEDINLFQKLIKLKTNLGTPITEMLINYQILSQKLISGKEFEFAIQTIQTCMDQIKLEVLVNYHSKLIFYESIFYELLGDCYRLQEQPQLAIDAYEDSISLKKEIKHKTDPKWVIYINLHIAALHFQIGDYQMALEIYLKALSLEEADVKEKNQFQSLGSIQYNIATVYFNLGKRDLAEDFCEQAILNMTSKIEEEDSMVKKAITLKEKIKQIKKSGKSPRKV